MEKTIKMRGSREYKYQGMKITFNHGKNGKIRLIIHLRETERAYYKTYYDKTEDRSYMTREGMVEFLSDFIGRNILQKRY